MTVRLMKARRSTHTTKAAVIGSATLPAPLLPTAAAHAELPQVSDQVCRPAAPGFAPKHELCAGYPKAGGPSGCAGDSGGPLVRKDDRDRWVQVGITSWGGSTDCGERGNVSGFVRVSAEAGAIAQAVKRLGG